MEKSALEIIANLGIAATVVAMAFYMFYRIFNKLVDDNREDNKALLNNHMQERQEWREQQKLINNEFTTALKEHAVSTTNALEKVINEIQSTFGVK